ncbi:uncharacterized protein LOC117175639 [Belonocnema kinseyi]|uniref:uncharacterized protein LOC117175639 n=1 Tax=Belonocnema kinseyi TaxID=2817044 RepID=UPI00143DF8B1|nr:uncharacterized protein LOC117175639 [Belonocnema kinseyi]
MRHSRHLLIVAGLFLKRPELRYKLSIHSDFVLNMPRHKYVIESRKPTIDAKALVAAVKEILIEKKALRSVARAYNIDKSRLFRYISKLNDSNLDPSTASEEKLIEFLSSLSTTPGGRTIFSEEQEKQLMTYLLEASKIYYGMSINELKILTYELAKKLGVDYPKAWDEHKKVSYDCANRAKAFSRANVNAFFGNLGAVFDQHTYEPHRIWNVDETGCPTVPTKAVKVIAEKGSRRIGQKISAERGTNVSVAFAVRATGQSIPPFYIFPRKNMQQIFMDNAAPGAVGTADESGWMTYT